MEPVPALKRAGLDEERVIVPEDRCARPAGEEAVGNGDRSTSHVERGVDERAVHNWEADRLLLEYEPGEYSFCTHWLDVCASITFANPPPNARLLMGCILS